MKKFTQLFLICIAIFTTKYTIAQTPTVPSGYAIRQVAKGGALADQVLDGIVADPNTGNLYVATVSAPFSSSFKLYKITPSGTVSYIDEYTMSHQEIVKMAFNPADGHIYVLDNNSGNMYKINPATGASSVYSTGMNFGGRYGLNFDASGSLILSFESLFTFYRVTASGPVFLGSVSANVPNGNHGDAFGIQPNGNYAVYTDCGGQNNYSISTAGHTDGSDYTTIAWTGTTNIFSEFDAGCGYSNGAIDPNTGDVYSTIANFGNGNKKILFTGADGGASSVFVNNASGIMDLCFGKESGSGSCNSLYFIDKNTNAVYEVPMNNCCFPQPGVVTVNGGGAYCGSTTITASGGTGGTVYFMGTDGTSKSTANPSTNEVVTTSGTYYFRAQITDGCWGKPGSVNVIIKPIPESPVISPGGDIIVCDANTETTLSIPASNFSDPITYNIDRKNLVNMNNNCNGSLYGDNVGISWTDNGSGIVTNVEVEFSIGIECGGPNHTTTFNSSEAEEFTTSSWCNCDPPNSQVKTINLSPSNYNLGGVNTLLFSGNTFGLYPDASLDNYFARVTVTYGAPLINWTPGGANTNSITVSPSETTEYTVTVTAQNGCSSSASKTITIGKTPSCSISGENTVCPSSTGNIYNAPASTNIYDWTISGNGSISGSSSSETVSVDAGSSCNGSFKLELKVEDENGCVSDCEKEVIVIDNTAPTGTAPLGKSGIDNCMPTDQEAKDDFDGSLVESGYTDNCSRIRATLTDYRVSGDNCKWDVKYTFTISDACGNELTGQTYSNSGGDKTAPTGTAPSGTSGIDNCMPTDQEAKNDFDRSLVEGGYTDNCSHIMATLTDYKVSGDDCRWDVKYTFTISDACGNELTGQTYSNSGGDKTAPEITCPETITRCGAQTVSYTATASDKCGNSTIIYSPASGSNFDVGTSTVTATATDECGNKSTCEFDVVINANPSCSISVKPSDNTYTGGVATNIYLGYGSQSATLTANATGGSGFTYSWSASSNLNYLSCTTCVSPVFTPTAEGSYTYTITVTNSNGCKTTCKVTFCVKNVQVSGSGKKVYLCHLPSGDPSKANTLSISVNAVNSHLTEHSGDALGKCGATCYSNKRTVISELVLDIEDIEITSSPNPFNQTFKVNYISSSDKEATISVYGITGNLLEKTKTSGNSNEIELGSNLPAGIYTVSFTQAQIIKVFKMIKVN